jgi:hypothetical protein
MEWKVEKSMGSAIETEKSNLKIAVSPICRALQLWLPDSVPDNTPTYLCDPEVNHSYVIVVRLIFVTSIHEFLESSSRLELQLYFRVVMELT